MLTQVTLVQEFDQAIT